MTPANLIVALEAVIARAERAEAERDKLMMEIQWVASIAGISGPKEEIAKAVGDIVIECGKWRELARRFAALHDFYEDRITLEAEDHLEDVLAKFKELEGK